MGVGVARERPQGGGSRSATHPAYQTALGEGEGGLRLNRNPTAMQTLCRPSSDCPPNPCGGPCPSPQTPGEMEEVLGWEGRQREGETPGEEQGEGETDTERGDPSQGVAAKAHGSEGLDKVN